MANNKESASISPLLLFHMREMLSEEINNKQVFNKLEINQREVFY